MSIRPHSIRSPLVCLGFALCATLAWPTSVSAQDAPESDATEKFNLPPNFDPNYRPKRTPSNTRVTIDFRQAQLEEVVKFFSGTMNQNFIISDSINTSKTITIISPKEVSLAEAYRAFLAALQMNGLTVVPFGSFYKIVESAKAIQEPQRPYGPDERVPNEARMVTAIIPIENSAVDEIQPVIQSFLTPEAKVIPFGTSLIITENGSNLRRIQDLVIKLDRGDSANKLYVYKVQHAEAAEIATRIEEIFSAQKGQAATGNARAQAQSKESSSGSGSGTDVTFSDIIADERTNQLIIVSDKKSFDRIREMIEILDVPTAVGGQVHVKSLEYADAEELASTLSSLSSGAQRSTPQQRNVRGQVAPSAPGDVATLLSGDVQITAYKPSNSLVVVAAPRDYMALETVIDLLDLPRRQVYVEAVIMEIGLDTNRQLGLGFSAGIGQDFDAFIPESAVEEGLISDTRGLIVGRSNFKGLEGAASSAGVLGLLGPQVTIPGTSISLPAFALLLQATQTDNSVNILSTPAILTMDNEEAEIVVGERVPFLRGVAAGGGGLSSLLGAVGGGDAATSAAASAAASLSGLGGLVSPIEYEDVGITLRIKPQVNESEYVRLEVNQEVSDIKGAGGLGAGAPITTRRTVKSVVLVKDQATVVIGGLIREVENETVEKVPFLGDIPLVGVLFRNTSVIKNKQNLVLMLTPYIIENEADLQKIQKRKMQEREELLKLFGRRDLQYVKSINFQKKTGLLDRMKTTIGTAVRDENARQEALKAFENVGPRYRILGEELPDPNSVEPSAETPEPEVE